MKIGDKVLCIDGSGLLHSFPRVIEGTEYVIDGFNCCPKCGTNVVFLAGFNLKSSCLCACGLPYGERQSFLKSRFILPNLESLHAHRVEVSAKELTEIKTIQLQ